MKWKRKQEAESIRGDEECGIKIKRKIKLKRPERKANDASQLFFKRKQRIDLC
jgi:hypothetical protein